MATVLIATDAPVWTPSNGAIVRLRALFEHLARRGHAVHVYSPLEITPAIAAQARGALPGVTLHHLHSSPPPLAARVLRAARRVAGAPPLEAPAPKRRPDQSLAEFRDARHLAAFGRVLAQTRAEVAVLHLIRLAYLREALPAGQGRPRWVIDTQDVMHERAARFHAQGEPHWIDIAEAEEAAALAPFDLVLAIQRRDAETLARMLPGRDILVLGHPSPIRPLPPHQGPVTRLGFVGEQSPPNRQAMERFLREVWPALHAAHGDSIRLEIAGPVCQALKDPPDGVDLLGFVDDLERFYTSCDILINPVFMGGGLKIKCVEALCHGRPLLTTPLGAEGLEEGIDTAFACCEDSPAMFSVLDAWISDPALRAGFGERALAFAHAHLSEEAVFAPLDAWLARAGQSLGH
jgi:glycosyltransferase involved in cell wall biosynthesis